MKKHPPPLKIRVAFEPNRFSSDSLTKAYEHLNQIQSYPITNLQKKAEGRVNTESKIRGKG